MEILLIFYYWFMINIGILTGLCVSSYILRKQTPKEFFLNIKNIFIFADDVLFGSPEAIRQDTYKGKSFTWFKWYAGKVGMALNPHPELVSNILKGMEIKRQKFGKQYCPCNITNTEDTVCPCKQMRENKYCHCGLFVLKTDLEPVVSPIENPPYKRADLPSYLEGGDTNLEALQGWVKRHSSFPEPAFTNQGQEQEGVS